MATNPTAGISDPAILRQTEAQLAQAAIIANGKPTVTGSELILPSTTVKTTSNTVIATTSTNNDPGDTVTVYAAPQGALYVNAIDQTIVNNPVAGVSSIVAGDGIAITATKGSGRGVVTINSTAANVGNIAVLNLDGNASNVLHGDGTWSADVTDYGNSNVAAYLPTYTGNITGDYANFTHDVTANVVDAAFLYGDGSNISNLAVGNIASINLDGSSSNVLYGNGVFAAAPSGGGLPLSNGNSIIDIATLDGNITLDSNGNVFTFGTDGNLTTPTNLVIGTSGAGGTSILQPDSALQVVGEGANATVVMGWAVNQSAPDSIAVIGMNTPYSNGAANLLLAVGNNATTVNYWNFSSSGTTTFPTLTVDLHNGGNQAGQVLQFGDDSQQAIITGPTPDVSGSAQRLIIQGQRGSGTGEGGDVYLWGGDSDLYGGDIKIYAGDADNVSSGSGGYVNIAGGDGFDGGGYVSMTAGQSGNGAGASASVTGGSGATQGGSANINGGYGTVDGGHVNIQGGFAATTGNGGNVNIIGGGSSNGLPGYGNVNITAGATSWVFGNDGNLTVPNNILVGGSASPAPYISGFSSITLHDYVKADQVVLANNAIYTDSGSSNLILNPQYGTATNGYVEVPTFQDGGEKLTIKNDYASGNGVDIVTQGGTWFFDGSGSLGLPGGTGVIESLANNVSIYNDVSQNNGIVMYNDGLGNEGIEVYGNSSVVIYTDFSNVGYQTTFQQSGNILTAGSILPGTANTFDLGNTTNRFNNAYFSGNVTATNIGNIANINLDGSSSNVLYGNGAFAAAPSSTYGDSNVVTLLSSFGSNTITTTGNVAAGAVTASGKIGYSAGANVTQTGSRSNSVTINGLSGEITLVASSMTAGQVDIFTVTNNQLEVGDMIICTTYAGSAGTYLPMAFVSSATQAVFTVRNLDSFVTASESPVIKFIVIKAPKA